MQATTGNFALTPAMNCYTLAHEPPPGEPSPLPFRTLMKKWMTSRTLFWLLTLLPLSLILGHESMGNDSLFHNHFANPQRLGMLAGALLSTLAGCAIVAKLRCIPLLPNSGRIWALFGLASLFSHLGNVSLYRADTLLLISAFSALGTMCILWTLLNRISLLFWIPFMLFEMVQTATYFQYGTTINNELVLAEVMEASRDEILSYMTPANICITILCLLVSCGLAHLLSRCMRGVGRMPLCILGIISLLIAGSAMSLSSPQKRNADNMWPMFELRMLPTNISTARTFNAEILDYVSSLPSPADKPSSISTLKENDGVVLILHVGESIRADRLGLNGYRNRGRSTTPWLDSLNGNRLINFSNCISSSYSTGYSLITILTDARRAIRASEGMVDGQQRKHSGLIDSAEPMSLAKAGSVMDLFSANLFTTYSFMGRIIGQDLRHDKVIRELSKTSRERYFAATLPQDVLPHMGKVLDALPRENLFFFINNEGNHVPFCYYDEDKAPFLPSRPIFSNPAAHAEGLNNAYDNSTHYTDEFIRKVAEKLQGRPFLYLYVSDHGEYLGHDGLWGRGGAGSRYQETTACRVGMFIITSPEFEALHPHFAAGVRNLRAHADMTVGHEHIYHTLLGLIGISSPYYDARLDLSGDSPEPYTGPQPTQASGTAIP